MDLGGFIIYFMFFILCYVLSDVGEALFNKKEKEYKNKKNKDKESD